MGEASPPASWSAKNIRSLSQYYLVNKMRVHKGSLREVLHNAGLEVAASLTVGSISILSKLTGYLQDMIAYNLFYESLANPYVLSSGPTGYFIELSHIAEAREIIMTNMRLWELAQHRAEPYSTTIELAGFCFGVALLIHCVYRRLIKCS